MKSGRFVEGTVLNGAYPRVEVEHSKDMTHHGPRESTVIRLKQSVGDSVMDESSWREFVKKVDEAIEAEKRGEC